MVVSIGVTKILEFQVRATRKNKTLRIFAKIKYSTAWGIGFCGYIILHYNILPRTKTKRRMFVKIEGRVKDYYKGVIDKFSVDQTLASYIGYLSHANTYKLLKKLEDGLPTIC